MKLSKLDERTLKMMENYVALRKEGRSVSKIAELYGLSPTTIYDHLDEIAENAGVSRDSLLERPFVADHSGRIKQALTIYKENIRQRLREFNPEE